MISSSEGPIEEQVARITGGTKAFATPSTPSVERPVPAVFRSLGAGGRMVVYGTLSGEPIQIDPRHMISGRKVVEGFWLGHWMRDRSIPASLLLFREIASLIRAGCPGLRSWPVLFLPQNQRGRCPSRGRRPWRQGPAETLRTPP